MNTQNQSILTTLYKCIAACNHCAASCLEEDDVKKMKDCIKTDMDCAQICSLTADLIARTSPHGQHLKKECAEVCNKCADECEKHTGMSHCMECAAACRECAKACGA